MKKNITIIVLVLVVLILAAFLFLKMNKNDLNLSPTPVVENPTINENNTVQNAPANNVVSDCLPTTAPWIKVLSPNGGEIFNIEPTLPKPNALEELPSGEIPVKLQTCNVSNTGHLRLLLVDSSNKQVSVSMVGFSYGDFLKHSFVPVGHISGKYKLVAELEDPNKYVATDVPFDSDTSDNFFTINIKSQTSTALPAKYLGAKNWPPVIQNSSVAYSCTPGAGSGDVPTTVKEKTINGKKYCVSSFIDAGAGQRFGEYTYTTASGSGTKTTHFTLSWSSCGGYGGPGGTEYDQCMSTVSNFLNNLDNLIASLM